MPTRIDRSTRAKSSFCDVIWQPLGCSVASAGPIKSQGVLTTIQSCNQYWNSLPLCNDVPWSFDQGGFHIDVYKFRCKQRRVLRYHTLRTTWRCYDANVCNYIIYIMDNKYNYRSFSTEYPATKKDHIYISSMMTFLSLFSWFLS
jgi:hypothetical protein